MIDHIDRKILTILQKKARVPNVDIARKVNMAPSAVLERIRKLEKKGIITGYEVRLDPEKFSRGVLAFIFITTGPQMNISALMKMSAIQEIHYISGGDGYLLKVRVPDIKAMYQFISDISALGVCAVKTHVVLDTVKETSHIPLSISTAKRPEDDTNSK